MLSMGEIFWSGHSVTKDIVVVHSRLAAGVIRVAGLVMVAGVQRRQKRIP